MLDSFAQKQRLATKTTNFLQLFRENSYFSCLLAANLKNRFISRVFVQSLNELLDSLQSLPRLRMAAAQFFL